MDAIACEIAVFLRLKPHDEIFHKLETKIYQHDKILKHGNEILDLGNIWRFMMVLCGKILRLWSGRHKHHTVDLRKVGK